MLEQSALLSSSKAAKPPSRQAAKPPSRQAAKLKSPFPKIGSSGNSACKSILVVEADQMIRESLQMLLECTGFQVYSARNGEEGLNLLRMMPYPSLVFLVLRMPAVDGIEFMKIKNHDKTIASVPVCIISSEVDRARVPQFEGFIKRPYHYTDLYKFVRRYCGDFSVVR